MKKFIVSMSLLLALSTVFILGSAFASTFTICDNNQGSNINVNCNEVWIFGSHQVNAHTGYNGNLSQKDSTSGEYVIRNIERSGGFASGSTGLYVYLADSDFTTTSTSYYWFYNHGTVGTYIGAINQFSAPNGWSGVGTYNPGFSVSNYQIQLDVGSSGATGSDAFEIVSP